MIPKEILKKHYEEYANQPDSWVSNMKLVKKTILEQVLKNINSLPSKDPISVVVLGASDKRYIKIHKDIFHETTKKEIKMITFDIDTEHLGNGKDVIYHDVTEPFPLKFDIIFSHELMKFLEPEEQIKGIKNSCNALNKGGFAMHIIHEPSIKGTKELRDWQYRVNPDLILKKLKEENIPCRKITFKIKSDVDWLRETTVILIEK